MDRDSAYTNLAEWFEYLNQDCDYENWSQFLITRLQGYPVKKGLDVGCGAGWFTRFFQKNGYEMTGLDISAKMLAAAQENARKAGLRGEYIQGDIAKIKLPRRYDFVLSVNDCFNYMPTESLSSAFKNVASALVKKGIFFFDVSSPKKFREKVANTICADDREDVTYLNFISSEGNKVTMDVTLFTRRADGAFDRKDERHVQYVHEEEDILKALEGAGFSVVEICGHLGEDKADSDRLCFLAQRR
ncbi:MAG: methyltransferase domain-containing protein [Clostridia bacterium]|nr:methyltransferase domain-containing protein [Clostridia bacterium]